MRELDLAWAAGLFEGEGSITIARLARKTANEGYALRLAVGMTDEECIDLLHQILGGWKLRRAYDTSASGGNKPIWLWHCGSAKAGGIVAVLLPYFRSARVRQKADLALEFQAQKRRGAARYIEGYTDQQRAYFQRMRVLNERGLANRVY